MPSNREILHVVPRGYIVDGQEGIKDPLGMSAVRLEVETHIVAGAATSVQNLTKCVTTNGVQIDEMVISSLAAAEATLTDTEKELGVLVADIGGGTTDIAIFVDGAVYHTAVLPVGGINVTNDVAIGLRTSLNLAEEIKIKHGTANMAEVEPEELLNVAVLGESAGQTIQRRRLCEIIEARMGEICSLIREEVKRSGHAGMLPAGAVLTGGGAGCRASRSWPARRSTCRCAPARRRASAASWTRSATRPSRRPSASCCGAPTTRRGAAAATGGANGTNPLSRVGEWVRDLFPG